MNNKELYRELQDIFEDLALEVIENPFFSFVKIPEYIDKIINEVCITLNDEQYSQIYRELYMFAHRVYRDPKLSSESYIHRIIEILNL